jgi:hypothetical protein
MTRKPPNKATGRASIQFGARGTAIQQNMVTSETTAIRRDLRPPEKHAGGRPSLEDQVVEIFDERRRCGKLLPRYMAEEARAIQQEMRRQGVIRPPSERTICGYAGFRVRWHD